MRIESRAKIQEPRQKNQTPSYKPKLSLDSWLLILDSFLKTMPSSVVAAMEYNDEAQILRITYTSGAVYDYRNVPPDVYEDMKEADSKGTFLNYEIKGKYRYKRVK